MIGLQGIDVSRFNGPVDWGKVAASGVKFAWLQACRGVSDPDNQALNNILGAKRNNILLGLYQRVFPAQGGPAEHARAFLDVWLNLYADLPAVMLPTAVDYEDRVPGGGAWCLEYIRHLRLATGRRNFVVYAPGSMFGSDIEMAPIDADPGVHLWVADTGKFTGATPGNPRYRHSKMIAHQYSHEGLVPGVTGNCDKNISTALFPPGGC